MAASSTTPLSGAHTQKRAEVRKPVKHSAILHYQGTQIPVVLQDLSHNGARVGFHAGRAGTVIDGPATLEVPGALSLPLTVRWQKHAALGASFDLPPARKATYQLQIDRIIARAGR